MTRSRRAAWFLARLDSAGAVCATGGCSDSFDDGAGGERATAAHGDECRALVAALELVQRGRDEPAAGRADGMTEGNGATVDVDLVHIRLDDAGPREGYGGERFVDFEDVDVVLRHPRLVENALGGLGRSVEEVVGVGADESLGHDARTGPDAELLGLVRGHPQDGCRAIGDLRAVAGG